MKKVFTTLLISLITPFIALAAFNDVQLSTGSTVVLSVGGSNLEFTVTDGNVQDVQVNNSNAVFTLAAGSTVTISSSDRKKLDHNSLNNARASFDCSSSSSSISLSLPTGASDEAVTVTPTTEACKDPTATAAYVYGTETTAPEPTPAPTPTPTPTPTSEPAAVSQPAVAEVPAAEVAQPSPVAQLVSPVFNRDLQVGNRSDEVRRLQELLAQDKELYPEGLVTGYYGSLTREAVRRFQLRHGVISSPTEPGNGRLGPKTRAKLKEVYGEGVSKPSGETPTTPPAEVVQALQEQIKALLEQVQALQAQIKARQGQ